MKLSDYLTEHNIKQSVFAEQIGISDVRLSRLINARTPIQVDTIQAINVATDGAVVFDDWVDHYKKPGSAGVE